jgi:hypothetical protein
MIKYLNWSKKLHLFAEITVHLDINIQYDKEGNMEYYNALLLHTVHYGGTLDATHSAPWQDFALLLMETAKTPAFSRYLGKLLNVII